MSNVMTRSEMVYASKKEAGHSSLDESMPYIGAAVPVGLVGAAFVALSVLIVDWLAGSPLGTPNALGAALFRGETFALQAPIEPALVFGYTMLHGTAFVVVAAAAVSAEYTLVQRGVSLPVQFASGIAGLFFGLQAMFLALTVLLDISWTGDLGMGRIVMANAIAAVTMAITVYLRGHGRQLSRKHARAAARRRAYEGR
ncbi:MAG: hypothetical protein JRF61_04275 [Deltaproteobacteria bacterium]|jgi:hypothetical protein|nr:hypothetical protein [Deltaproteobacteria bacterium]